MILEQIKGPENLKNMSLKSFAFLLGKYVPFSLKRSVIQEAIWRQILGLWS